MTTKTKGIAFHNEYERATLGSQKDELGNDITLKEIIGAIAVVALLYIIGNLVLGLN